MVERCAAVCSILGSSHTSVCRYMFKISGTRWLIYDTDYQEVSSCALDMNLRNPLHICDKVCKQGLWNPGQTSPKVQNRSISGPTKGICVLQNSFCLYFTKKIVLLRRKSSKMFTDDEKVRRTHYGHLITGRGNRTVDGDSFVLLTDNNNTLTVTRVTHRDRKLIIRHLVVEKEQLMRLLPVFVCWQVFF